MKRQIVTLAIVYDDETENAPIAWDWGAILDIGPNAYLVEMSADDPVDEPEENEP